MSAKYARFVVACDAKAKLKLKGEVDTNDKRTQSS